MIGKDIPFVWGLACSDSFRTLRDSLIQAPILAFLAETGQYILDTDTSNFGLDGVLSQIQNNVEHVVAYCSCALRRYCKTKREMLAAVSMCIQFRSYLRAPSSPFELTTNHLCGCTGSRIPKVWWPDGCMPYNNSNFRLFIGPVENMETLTASLEYPHHRLDSVLV